MQVGASTRWGTSGEDPIPPMGVAPAEHSLPAWHAELGCPTLTAQKAMLGGVGGWVGARYRGSLVSRVGLSQAEGAVD